MVINKIVIKNFKSFKDFELTLPNDIAIIVGDNEVGKTSLLEAINLALTSQLNGRNIVYELTPYIFNSSVKNEYIRMLRNGDNPVPPSIIIELYLKENQDIASLKGSNNTKRENCPGIQLLIQFNDDYADEYLKYIENPSEVQTIPVEYYEVKWYSFAYNTITRRSIPFNVTLVDTTSSKTFYGADKYISNIINDVLDDREKAQLSLSYRKLKESFASQDAISQINNKINLTKGNITDKNLEVSIDISSNSHWESALTSYLDDVPFSYAGKGEQSSVQMKLALETNAQDSSIVLVEEPENHLSFSNMNKLIKGISEKCVGKQLILTTHSTYVINKLGLENLILFNNNKKTMSLSNLSDETKDYFKKLPDYDTLRMVLATDPILCEGPSDELIIQKAYLNKYGKLPVEDGVDIITVKGLSFKRFLEIAKLLNKKVKVVTDNDGDTTALKKKYIDYDGYGDIKIYYDEDTQYKTLEPQICKINDLDTLNNLFERDDKNIDDMQHYMVNNKTSCALKIFESDENIKLPRYIYNAIKK